MKELFKKIILAGNFATPSSEWLYKIASRFIGVDASPDDRAPDEYGCADTVNMIVKVAFGKEVGGDVSTYRMIKALKVNNLFAQVTKPIRGDIIISPTGYGGNSLVKNGHVGIVGNNGQIMSNDSDTGKFLLKYNLDSWEQRYRVKGRYPIYYFRRIFKS